MSNALHAAVLLADGFEEIEAITIVDVLRRASIEVTTVAAYTNGKDVAVTGAHNLVVVADLAIAAIVGRTFDAVVLPGGMPGAGHLRDSVEVKNLVMQTAQRGGLVAAICAAPMALGHFGLLKGKRACCYPGFEAELKGATVVTDRVTVDGRIVTSRGPGTSLSFALALVQQLCGDEKAASLSSAMLVA
jgi:4-methyl-5(b-hydroxyethyl)-thiazole monophosphate biosynthesis